MNSKLKILLLEDDAADAELIARELEASGVSFRLERIHTKAELRREMETETPDLVLSDHGLPSFDGFEALEIVRERNPKLPFIFVSGSNDQGMVAKMYEEGATDYVFKRDIGDLKSAVLQALEPQPEATQPPTEPGVIPAQHELGSQLPAVSPRQPIFSPPIGHLLFCPRCRQTRDTGGRPVQIENYFDSHAEIVIFRQFCAECDRPRPLS